MTRAEEVANHLQNLYHRLHTDRNEDVSDATMYLSSLPEFNQSPGYELTKHDVYRAYVAARCGEKFHQDVADALNKIRAPKADEGVVGKCAYDAVNGLLRQAYLDRDENRDRANTLRGQRDELHQKVAKTPNRS